MRTYNRPKECSLSKQAVDSLAASVASQLGYRAGAPLEPIVHGLGGKIILSSGADISDNSSGSIRIRSESDFEIILARHTGPTRDRFTIAHELGHYVLHYLWPRRHGIDPGWIEAQRYGTGRVEWEANWFAAGFLMPEEIFRELATRLSSDVNALATAFNVSSEAARVRASNLGLI